MYNLDSHAPEARAVTIAALKANHGFAIVEWLDSVDSTSNYLKRLIHQDLPLRLPRLVIADHQTAGRGRGSNTWWSSTGCLTFSILYSPPPITPSCEINQLGLVVGLAMCDALDPWLAVPCKLKWPNDVYVEDRKVAGILVESISVGSSHPDHADGPIMIIGIGINLLVDLANAPSEILARATSFHLHTNRDFDFESVLQSVCTQLFFHFNQWHNQPDYLTARWPLRCWLTGKCVTIESASGTVRGHCLGTDPSGALLISDESRITRRILTGTVRIHNERSIRCWQN